MHLSWVYVQPSSSDCYWNYFQYKLLLMRTESDLYLVLDLFINYPFLLLMTHPWQ